ncbi:MAG: MFS transporter [Acidobacteria bacterium]|nr:MFS transporter [Acidobacteriota bacterium]
MRVFYGWVIAACAFCTLLVTNGLIITGINAFDASLLAEFGWSRGGLKFRDLLTFIAAGLLAPVGGALSDRFGVRRMMLTGAALLAVCLWAYSHIHSAAGMYAVHVLFAVVLVTCGLMVCVLLTSHWFVAARGTALGFVIIGTSLGGVVFPVLNTVVIAAYGWRTAMQLLIAAPLLLWVAIAALVRDSPADKGLQPYGAGRAVPAAGTTRRQPERSVPYGQALRTTTFWALAVTAMSTFYAILATQAHLILYLRSLGASPVKAASGLSTLFVMGMIGKFLFGMLADLYDKQRVLQVNLLVMWIGGLALASMSPGAVWFAIALFGLGWGGIYTLLQVITMTAFGLAAGGKILGTITVLDAIGGGLGIWLTGLLYDRTGSYASAFAIVAGLITLAAGASTLVNVGLGADGRPAISET